MAQLLSVNVGLPRDIEWNGISYAVGTYYSTGLLTKAVKIQVENDGRLTVPGEC